MTTTLNPSDKGGAGLTLSGGNLTASNLTANPLSVRGTTSNVSGKWYFEAAIIAKSSSPVIAVGFSDASFVVTSYIGTSDISIGYAELGIGSGVYLKSASFGGGSTFGTEGLVGDVFGCAVDFDSVPGTPRFFFAVNNVWQNSGNPATGAGAKSVTSSNALYPTASLSGDGALPDTTTINFGASAQTYSPPSGYLSWDELATETGYPRIIML